MNGNDATPHRERVIDINSCSQWSVKGLCLYSLINYNHFNETLVKQIRNSIMDNLKLVSCVSNNSYLLKKSKFVLVFKTFKSLEGKQRLGHAVYLWDLAGENLRCVS